MSTFTYNEHTGHYEAVDGGHSVYIADDVFMTELELLKQSEDMTDTEAFDELSDVAWWYDRLPMTGVFIDGEEQTDEARLAKESRRQLDIETYVF